MTTYQSPFTITSGITTTVGSGTIVGNSTSSLNGVAVNSAASGASLTNSGTILGLAGVYVQPGAGNVAVTNNGYIGSRNYAYPNASFEYGVALNGPHNTLLNFGTIKGFIEGVELGGTGGTPGGIVSNGVGGYIYGKYNAIWEYNAVNATLVNAGRINNSNSASEGAVVFYHGGTVTNLASGTITSDGNQYGVRIKGGNGTVINAGTIDVGVTLTSGYSNRVVVDPGAYFGGSVDGGGGTLELASGSGTGTLTEAGGGYGGFAATTLNAGGSWLIKADSSVNAALGAISGFTATDTIQIAGHETITGQSTSAGATYVTLTGASPMTLKLQGAIPTLQASYTGSVTNLAEATGPTLTTSGTVTFTGGGSAVTLDSGATVADTNNVTTGTVWINSGFVLGDQLKFTNQNGITGVFNGTTGTLTLSGTASAANWQAALDSITFGFSPSNGDPTNAGNSKTRTIDWQVADASGSSAVASSNVITQESSILSYGQTIEETGILAASETVSADVMTLFNSGNTMVGTIAVGTTLGTGNFLLSTSGSNSYIVDDTVLGTYTSGKTLVTNPTTISASAKVTDTAANGIAVSAASGTSWTLVNQGAVSETGSGHSYGVWLPGSSVLTNSSGGTIAGYYGGVGAYPGGTIVNHGTIQQNSTTQGEGIRFASTGSLNNSGLITAAFNGVTGNGLTVDNTGSIVGTKQGLHFRGVVYNRASGLLSGGTDGVYIGGLGSTIYNYGIITGGTGIYASTYGGVQPQTIIDSGTIIGTSGTAIALHSAANLVKLLPGFAIQGTVNGGSGGATLELASAATVGTISGLGTQFVGFSQVTIDAGAQWTLGGSNSIANGETLTNAGTGTIADTLANAGSIGGNVLDLTGAVLTNFSGGVISSYILGVYARGADTVVNQGTINVTGSDAINLNPSGGNVTNAGGALIESSLMGVVGSGVVANYGTILGGTSSNGLGAAAHTIANLGSASLIEGYLGIGDSDTVINQGTIASSQGTSGQAVAMAANGVLVEAPTGRLIGSVSGIAGRDTTFELASGSSAGTIAGFGGSITNFSTLVFDSGAQWTVAGNDSASGLGTLAIEGFAAGDTIDLTNFAATGSAFSGNHLTLTSGASSVTLDIQGGFITQQFLIGSDGSTGTGITLQAPALHYGETVEEAGIVASSETVNAGVMTLFNSGNTAVGTIGVGTSLSTGEFLVTNNGTNSQVILDTVFGTYTSGITLLTDPTTIAASGTIGDTAAGGVAVSGPSGTNWTLANYGQVSASGSSGIGVSLAFAGSITNASGGTITAAGTGIVLAGGGAVSNQSGGTISGLNGVYALGAATTVVNAGSILGSSSQTLGTGVNLDTSGLISNQAGGLITGFDGVYAHGAATVVNAGSILGSSSQTLGTGVNIDTSGLISNQAGGVITGFDGVYAYGAATVVNAGSIGGSTAQAKASGIDLHSGGSVSNQSGGLISGIDGVYAHRAATTVVNAGSILGSSSQTHGTGVNLDTSGLVSNQSGGLITGIDGVYAYGAATVVNAGSIGGSSSQTYAAGISLNAGGSISNQSGGSITGYYGVYAHGTATVVNAGSIGGNTSQTYGAGISLNAGGSISNQSGGSITGFDGAYAYGAATVVNAGSIGGSTAQAKASGIDLHSGGSVSNQSGGLISGVDGVYAHRAATTVVNAGSILGSSSQTHGTGVNLDISGLVSNQSGGLIAGIDGVYAYGAATVVNAGSIGGSSTQTYGAGINLNAGGSISNQSGGSITGFDGVYAYGAATVVNAGSIGGDSVSGIGIDLSKGGTVTNSGTISGGKDAVTLASGQTNRLVIDPGAVFSGTADGGNTIGSSSISTLELASGASNGTLSGLSSQFVNFAQTTIDANANWTVTGSNTVVTGATLINSGSFTAVGTLANDGTFTGNGLRLDNGSFTNQTSGVLTANAIYGLTGSTDSVLNQGTIANTLGDSIYLNGTGNVTNAAGALIEGTRDGVYSANGSLTNYGSIIASNTTAPGYGISIGLAGTVSNLGVSALIKGYAGVAIGVNGTVVNQGTIASSQGTIGTAVSFTGGNARLIESPTATLIGGAYGGTGGTAVLELASGASAGTISGLGTSIDDFTSLAFDSGAQWTVAGNDSASGLGTLGISGFTYGDTIDLTNFSAVSRTFSSNALVLTDGANAHETLHIAGSFVTNEFQFGSDGSGGTDVYLRQIPTITAGGTASFEGGATAVALDANLSVTDALSVPLTSAEVWINSGFISGDILNYSGLAGLGITGSYDPNTGTLTLSGTSSIANFQSALDSVTYSFNPSNGDPTGGGGDLSRTIDWVASDGTSVSQAVTSVVDVAHIAPSVTASGTAAFAIGGSAAVLDPSIVVSDPDSGGLLTGATIVIANGFQSGDVLNFINSGGIAGSYNPSTGTLVLSGTASIANYESVLASITYSYGGSDPSSGATDPTRAITWQVTDGSSSNGLSNIGTTSLNVYGPPPVIGGTSGTVATYIQQGASVALDNAVTVSDGDSTTLTGATVTISGGYLAGDTLAAATAGTAITAVYNNGTLTLSGTDTLANYQQVLRSVTYASSATDPTNGGSDFTRTLVWQVNDGRGGNNLSNLGTTTVDTHVRPVVTAGNTVTFGIGGGAILVDAGLGVTDADTNPIATGTVAITGGLLAGDVLAFNNGTDTESFGDGATLSASFNSGTLTFTESGSQASATDWQQALESVTFSNVGADPSVGGTDPTRTLTWTLNTADPAQTSVAVASTIDIAPPPVIAGTVSGQATTDEATLSPFSGVTITDPNIGQTDTVTITLSDAANGTLSNLGGGTFNSGTYTVTGNALSVTAAIDGLVFTPTAHEVTPGATVTTGFAISVVDSVRATSGDSTTSVIATAVSDPPTIVQSAVALGDPNESAINPFTVLTVADPDVGPISYTLTVTLSDPAGGTLSNLSGGSYNTATGVYTATGSVASLTNDLAALVFTPAAPPAGSYTATTQFTVHVTGPGGSASNNAISVTAVAQDVPGVPGGATTNTISISPDGSSFAPANPGDTNEAVISQPTTGGSYTIPSGYQAAYLGGSAGATLTDDSVNGAVLVGNSGNDTLSAGANDVTLNGGAGDNTFEASGTHDVIATTGTATVRASGTDDFIAATSGVTSIQSSGTGVGILGGAGETMYVSMTDSNGLLAANGATVSASVAGTGDTLVGGSAAETVHAASSALMFGGTGPITFVGEAGTSTLVGAANGTEMVTVGSGGMVFASGTDSNATVTSGTGTATLFGASNSNITFNGSLGSALYVAGVGNETLNAAGSSTNNTMVAGSDTAGGDSMVGGSGNDTMIAGGGADTMVMGSGNDAAVFFKSNTHGAHDFIADFNPSKDSVFLLGYDSTQSASYLENHATTNSSGVTLTLSDNTQITFTNLTNASQLIGKMLYV